ncbi:MULTISPECIES: lysozyme inhibitor LprI family protein [Methylomonas]|uniref:Lysozyme inhibitor LprI N-terminal domain-containing protein n=2 Tax=Methylomonas methanica TaxID=421 RepID=A0ABY2CFL0_METMH|nr:MULTISPECIES: lysozyme inhibitor LprI family protein [Methylomonas]TCV74179.1 uncharacterized protein EDE11_1403 [Methylomonas methanica]
MNLNNLFRTEIRGNARWLLRLRVLHRFVFLFLWSVSTPYAASFDCNKVQSKIERKICSDQSLSKLDDELSIIYRKVLDRISIPGQIKAEQSIWLKKRNQCLDIPCIHTEYQQRIDDLNKVINLFPEISQKVTAISNTPQITVPSSSTPAACSVANDPYRTEEPDIDWRNYQWTLILGNGTTACEEMLGYLKKRPKHLPPPVCPEERLPPNGHWRRPDGRDLIDAERQVLLDGVPETTRPLFEKEFKDKYLRIIHTGIKTDQVSEWYLAYTGEQRFSNVSRNCRLATQCAQAPDKTIGTSKQIVLGGAYSYDIMNLNEDGTQIHPILRQYGPNQDNHGKGELVFYKGAPYWLGDITWQQHMHDHYVNYLLRADDPYSSIFTLGRWHQIVPGCRFGYFNHDNLKQFPPSKRR